MQYQLFRKKSGLFSRRAVLGHIQLTLPFRNLIRLKIHLAIKIIKMNEPIIFLSKLYQIFDDNVLKHLDSSPSA